MIDIKLSSVELTGFDEGQLAPTRGLRYRGHRRLGSHEGGRTKRNLEKIAKRKITLSSALAALSGVSLTYGLRRFHLYGPSIRLR